MTTILVVDVGILRTDSGNWNQKGSDPVRTFITSPRNPSTMTENTHTDIHFSSESDAVAMIEKFFENTDTLDEFLHVIDQTTDTIIEAYSLNEDVDRASLARDLTIGYVEWVCIFFEAGVKTAQDFPAFLDDIQEDLLSNSQLVLGRMTDRSRACRLVSKAMLER